MKEEEGGCSSQKRRAEWASLQPDLVQSIADCVLSTSGVDEYMAMRAVCPIWRSAVAKPSPHAAVADCRFRPRQWVLLHGADDDQGRPLFLNDSTGRFRRLRRPVLRDYIFVGASDGLLVLGARERPHAALVLNPLTGDMLFFAAPIPPERWVRAAITGNEPSIIFSFPPEDGEYEDMPDYCCLGRDCHVVYSADPTGQLREVKFDNAAFNEDGLFYLRSMVTYAGNVYVLTYEGTLCKIVWTGGHWYAERILEIGMKLGWLVESAGKLLFVKQKVKTIETIELFYVDVNRKVLEPIESIGSCTLFLSSGGCMVVNADQLPSIKRNCFYINITDRTYVWYDLSSGQKTYITPGDGPLSLVKVLLTPYPQVKAQLDRIQQF